MSKNKELYSFSKLNAFHQCPYQYYLNYILKEEGKQNVYGYLGGVVHDLCEKLSKEEMTLEDAIDKWFEEIDKLEESDMKFPTEKSKIAYIECVSDYLEYFTPLPGKEIHTEEYFILDVEGNSLRGFIDFYSVDHENKTIDLIDYKTSSKFSKKDLESEKVYQLILYGMYLEKKYPEYKINNVGFDMLKYAKNIYTGKVKLRNEIMKYEMYDYDRWLLYINYNDENKKKLKEFIINTINEIHSRNRNEESDWKDNSKNSFYCNSLCSFGDKCKYNKKIKRRFKTNK